MNGIKHMIEFWFEFKRFVDEYDEDECYSHLNVEKLIEIFREKRQLLQHRFDNKQSLFTDFVRNSEVNVAFFTERKDADGLG